MNRTILLKISKNQHQFIKNAYNCILDVQMKDNLNPFFLTEPQVPNT